MPLFRVRVRLISRLALAGVVALTGLFSSVIPLVAQEMPRALAPRALRLIDGVGRPIVGNCRDPHWNARGNGVFFTLEANGTRNIWRAFPDPNDSSRFAPWRAFPVTKLKAPQGAARPVPLSGDRDLICLQQWGTTSQLARLNLATGRFTTIVHATHSPDDPAPSPNGGAVAFTGEHGNQPSIFLFQGEANPRLLASLARRPVWLDSTTLLYESLNSRSPGLYRLSLAPNAEPELVMVGGGEAGPLPGGVGTVFAARTSVGEPTRLYLIARDGSGLRVLKGTEGARRPVPSRQGTIVYDAPLEADGPRTLWVMGLEMKPTAPTNFLMPNRLAERNAAPVPTARASAQQTERPADNMRVASRFNQPPVFPSVAATALVPPLPPLALPGIASPIGGTSRSRAVAPRETAPVASSGFGSSIFSAAPTGTLVNASIGGEDPVGQLLSVRRAVLSSTRLDDSAGGGGSSEALAVIGTLGGADVQATLEAGAGQMPTQWTTVPVASAAVTQAPFAFWTPPLNARGTWTLRLTVTNRRGAVQSLLRVQLPLPRLAFAPNSVGGSPLPPPAPAPRSTPAPSPTPELRPAPRPVPFEPLPPLPPAPTRTPVPNRTVAPNRLPAPLPSPAPRPRSTEAPLPPETSTPSPPGTFAGTFNISGTLATMAPGQKARVTFWGLNRGDTTWQVGASGKGRVRLIARWVDFSTGTRRKWNVIWLKTPVNPGTRTNWEFDLEAPTRPGKYKLIYGLVRWPDTDDFVPPPYNAPQAAWTGEFAAIAFAIDVVPRSAP